LKRTAIINVVGLSESLLGPHTPALNAFRQRGSFYHIKPAFPAVTCTAQSNYLTGQTPAVHGIVANGCYNRELAEVHFWKQSNHIVRAKKIWDELKAIDSTFTCAQLFWWFNMYSTADWSITPRPIYPADGRKVFDIYSSPSNIRAEIKKDLGEFPFPGFWGPAAGVQTPQGPPDSVSKWIAQSAKWIEERFKPTLNLIYLPHLDYNLQRLGPGHPEIAKDLGRIDAIAGDLIQHLESRSVQVAVLSEYGISAVTQPIHLNRLFRARGWIAIREELGRELLDCGASQVFAVADHQVAHVYLNNTSLESAARMELEKTPGVERVLGRAEQQAMGIDHERSGDLIAVAKENAWFTYYYWLDDDCAPDFARTVDIHRKPGYDPVELFLDPALRFPKFKIASRLVRKKMGFRMLMDIIPLDASLVRGSHGRLPENRKEWPILMRPGETKAERGEIESTEIYRTIKELVLA
jgi:predicted AlkP superfamily pyrophosphatase or phosphodiesterase